MSEINLGQIKGLTVNNNVVAVPSGHTLYAPGHVIQTVNATFDENFSTTSSTYTNTPTAATITPKYATSKILVIVSANMYVPQAQKYGRGTIRRGAIEIGNQYNGLASIYSNAIDLVTQVGVTILDTPATTSPVTYTWAIAATNGASTVHSPLSNNRNSITLLEIAA